MKAANKNVNLTDLKESMKQFLAVLENELGRELIITSGYRSPSHPVEIKKSKPGEHTQGLAVDVAAVGGYEVFTLVKKAMELGCKRIGISRKSNFVHLGMDDARVTSIWTY